MSKILIIEDDLTMVSLLKTLLGIDGYDVVAFVGGEDMMQTINREMPDVVLLDVNFKNFGINDTNGFDLMKRVRADDTLKDLSVIMSSGINYRQESKAAGADGFIMKPYMPDDLLNLIKEIL